MSAHTAESRWSASRSWMHGVVAVVLVVFCLVGCGVSLSVGAGDLSDPTMGATFFWLRAYRTAAAVLAGGGLAVGGVLVQGLFRNPLASPSILGTTAGASLGGIVVLLLWSALSTWMGTLGMPRELLLPLGCLVGAWAALGVLLWVTGRSAGSISLLLTGFILSSLFLSIAGLLTSIAQDTWELGRAVVAFTLGGVASTGPRHVALAAPLVLGGAVAAMGWSRHLDVLLSGEDEAAALGVDVRVVRRWVIIWTATVTAAAVAIGGNIAFVGLVVPHALRPFLGEQHRWLTPAAWVGGAAFVTWADVLVRMVPATGQVPLGVVTGLIGAPVFLTLLARAARRGELG